ncbi:MAG: hypothetical protein WA049_07965 [Ferribacterium limneticum]
MNKKIAIAALSVLLVAACSKKQEIVFEAKSISYKRGDSYMVSTMQEECDKLSKEVSSYLKDGWRVVTSTPKEIPVALNTGMCVGTEYIVEK